MRLWRSSFALLWLVLASCSAPAPTDVTGLYSANDGIIELHRGPEGALRGYLRVKERIAALSPVEVRADTLRAHATYSDSAQAEVMGNLERGPVLVIEGREYHRSAVEEPADATVRGEIEAAYGRLAQALANKDFDAFQALRVTDFATIPPDGFPRSGPRMAERARGMIDRIQPPITTTNDILGLTERGTDAIATVRQKFTRMQMIEGVPHEIHTEVTQRETWTRTPEGWKLLFVDEVRDHLTLDNGQRVR